MNIRVAGIVKESIVDGPGIRYVIFAQGCKHNCPGCHNPRTHSFDEGYMVDIDDIIKELSLNPLLDGITFSGGEPLEQGDEFLDLAKRIKENSNLNIMVYTGYLYEAIIHSQNNSWKELLHLCDILVDGPFMEKEKDYRLVFKGSKNQRIINLKESKKEGRIILME
ncbi:ribonucleoside-triphosphate reductase class III activase subunit [Alkalibaculum bacchi]|uniref:Anaerobic ribonucleoside-triphosphate reductase-activating protein n=1 Tax=Alkalibaculum bacchi TaxID=645887 RepID=A0A366I990_9FIRM|nr:anaerobic ribonucleoside-triphosphate reductase activating protein [Alkalibaculum bacchi]RBP64516.1 ribonucleoside-triphosphate reductase class III activase subunit [Alkalibaculum bacchi]